MSTICAPHDEEFKSSVKVRLIGSLAMPNQFRTCADAKSLTMTDGPYTVTPEPFGTVFAIKTKDMGFPYFSGKSYGFIRAMSQWTGCAFYSGVGAQRFEMDSS